MSTRNTAIEDLPRILESNSPVKKRWGDSVDQAKAIDSIKRALVQITSSYKKESEPSTTTPTTCSEQSSSGSSSLKSRGILTTQQPRYETLQAAPAGSSTESSGMKEVPAPVYFDQENLPANGNFCNFSYTQSLPNQHGVYKHEKQLAQFHFAPYPSPPATARGPPAPPEQPYPSPPRNESDLMFTGLPYNITWQHAPAGHPPRQFASPWNEQNMNECLSPGDQVYTSHPNSPDVPLTPPDENESKPPKSFLNISDYAMQGMQPVKPGKTAWHPMDVFCTVPGRLSLLSGASKYNVTIGEVQRRLTYPESLNVSLLGGVLRRAKAKNGNHALRTQLEERAISIPTGRRKAASVSLFTSLLEGESAQLANDFNTLCEKFFPCRELAKAAYINDSHRYHIAQDQHVQRVMTTKQMISDMQELMEMNVVKNNEVMNTVGVTGHNAVPCPQLMTFELLTHGFGASALSAAFNVVQTYLDEMMKCMTQ